MPFRLAIGMIAVSTLALSAIVDTAHRARPDRLGASPVARTGAARPLVFEPNRGQADPRAQYVARGPEYTAFLTRRGPVLALRDRRGRAAGLAFRFVGARGTRPSASHALRETIDYFLGSRRIAVHGYASLDYHDVYPAIDLVYRGADGRLEYDWIVRPGAKTRTIELALAGAERIHLRRDGTLSITAGGIPLLQERAAAYQELGGKRRPVHVRVVLRGRRTLGFAVGAYDRSRPLVIDPELSGLATVGGSGPDTLLAGAANPNGDLDFAGSTVSVDFPRLGGFAAPGGGTDAVVVELTKDLAPVFTAVFGGRDFDQATGIAVAPSGAIVVAGNTFSPDFPLVQPADGTLGTGGCPAGRCSDGFVVWLSPSGSAISRSTYLGGSADDTLRFVRATDDGSLLVGGSTTSRDLAGLTAQGGADAFGATFDAQGGLVREFDIGGKGDDIALAGTAAGDDSWAIAGASASDGVGGADLGRFSTFLAATLDGGRTFSKSSFLTGSRFRNWATGIISTPAGLLVIGNGLPRGASSAGCNETSCAPAYFALVDPATLAPTKTTVLMPPGSRGGYDLEGLTGDASAGDYYGAFFTGGAYAVLTQLNPTGLFGAVQITGDCPDGCPQLVSLTTSLGNPGVFANAAVADANGNAYLGGQALPAAALPGAKIKGSSDGFVARIGGTGLPPPCECSKIATSVAGAKNFDAKRKSASFRFTVDWLMECTNGGGQGCAGAIDVTPPSGTDIKVTHPRREITCDGRCSAAAQVGVKGSFAVRGTSAVSLAPSRRAGKSFRFRFRTYCLVGRMRTEEADGVLSVVYDARGRLDRKRSDLNGDGRPDG